jgi:hypothetical protein
MKSKEMEEQIEIKVSSGSGGGVGARTSALGLPFQLQRWPLEGGPAQRTAFLAASLRLQWSSTHLPLPSPARPAWEHLPRLACSQSWRHNSKQDSQGPCPCAPTSVSWGDSQ